MSETNKEIVRQIEAAWTSGAVDELDQYFAPDFVAHSNIPGMPPGLEGAKMADGFVRQFLTDRKKEIVDMVAEGDKVFIRVHVTGTNTSGVPWLGAEPNGETYDFESWSVYTIRDGRVTAHTGLNDVWLFATQMGVVRPPIPA